MVKRMKSVDYFRTEILVASLYLLSHCNGIQQQVRLFRKNSTAFIYGFGNLHSLEQANLTSEQLAKVDRYCTKGVWDVYTVNSGWEQANPQEVFYQRLGVGNEQYFYCGEVNVSSLHSMRNIGAQITTTDQFDLYPLPSQMGPSVSFTDQVITNIYTGDRNSSLSLSVTGLSDWMLFSGPYLNGNSYCLTWKVDVYIRLMNVSEVFPDGTLRSIAKGCKPEIITHYKKEFIQELVVYTKDNRKHRFDSSVADVRFTGLDFTVIERFCVRGRWQFFGDVNFTGDFLIEGFRPSKCFNGFSKIKSFRHWGAVDMSSDSISLYSLNNQSGDEILITGYFELNITTQISSIATTGISSWSIFEGRRLDGKWNCTLPPAGLNEFFNFAEIAWYGLKTVGSVFKGCDLSAISLYKEKNL